MNQSSPLRVGVGGPVGSGKTALLDALCKRMRGERPFVFTNLREGVGVEETIRFIEREGMLGDNSPSHQKR